jgi:hypothetical protein
MLKDVSTYKSGSSVMVTSLVGWNSNLIRARSVSGIPVIEGDIFVILQGQPGASFGAPGIYEIGAITDDNTLELLQIAPGSDPTTFQSLALDADLFEYGANLKCVIARRCLNPVIRGTDLSTINTDNLITSASAGFKTNAVSIGDCLVIESGANKGEYIIDAITSFSPPSTPPLLSETQVRLLKSDGTIPTFSTLSGQSYRVIRPYLRSNTIYNATSFYNGSKIILKVLDPQTSDQMDIFSPGMVGTEIEITGSQNPANDGKQLITDYINCGEVELGLSSSVVSDTVAQSTIYF